MTLILGIVFIIFIDLILNKALNLLKKEQHAMKYGNNVYF